MFKIEVPFELGSCCVGGRFVALASDRLAYVTCLEVGMASESGHDSSSSPLSARPIWHTDSVREVVDMSLMDSRLAIASLNVLHVMDLLKGESVCRKSSTGLTTVSWSASHNSPSGGCILGCGSESGAVQLWDLRTPGGIQSVSENIIYRQCPLSVSLLRFNPYCSDLRFFASLHDDQILLAWDWRQMKSPVVKIIAGATNSPPIYSMEWIGEQDIFLGSPIEGASCVVSPLDVGAYRSLPEFSFNDDPVFATCALQTDSSNRPPLMGFATNGEIKWFDSNTKKMNEFSVDHSTRSLGFVTSGSVAALCSIGDCSQGNSPSTVLIQPLPKNAISFDLPRSPPLQKASPPVVVPAHTDSVPNEFQKEIRLVLNRIARKLRRMYFEVSEFGDGGSGGDSDLSGLEITLDDPTSLKRLKILGSIHTLKSVVPDQSSIKWQLWWAGLLGDDELSSSSTELPDTSVILKKYLSSISTADLLLCPEKLVSAIADISKEFVVADNVPRSLSMDDNNPTPFPATCGMCWTPRGDLFRFHSLRGMAPWPIRRPNRFTMQHFDALRGEIEIVGPGMSSSRGGKNIQYNGISMNTFIPYVEEELGNTSADELDREFTRSVFLDTCVQFMPSTVFEQSVEDHCFAQIAPAVDFSFLGRKNFAKICDKMAHYISELQLQQPNNQVLSLIHTAWTVAATAFSSITVMGFCNGSGLLTVVFGIFEKIIADLYRKEQMQAVAVLVVLVLELHNSVAVAQSGENRGSTIWTKHPVMEKNILDSKMKASKLFPDHPVFSQSLLLVVHDHMSLFHRLGCWNTARVMEKILRHSKLPALVSPEEIFFASHGVPPCSLCHQPVKGLQRYCLSCSHGGHLKHMISHFSSNAKCFACDCRCENVAKSLSSLLVAPVASKLLWRSRTQSVDAAE